MRITVSGTHASGKSTLITDFILDLADDPDLTGDARVIELAGSPQQRLAQLETSARLFEK